MSSYTRCHTCGEEGHYARQCTAALPASPEPLQSTPMPLPASAYRRAASEICPPTAEYLAAREALTGHGMPGWLWKRMEAWHQVNASRNDPFRLARITAGYAG